MGLKLAWLAFVKAFKDPKGAEKFLGPEKVEEPKKEDFSHLKLLALLQKQARLIDFLKEDISHFSDAQVGAAVRKIHLESNKSLEEYVTLRPVLEGKEGQSYTAPQGYDPMQIKVLGKVKGEPPYTGILRHPGWKAHKKSLPKSLQDEGDLMVVAPAEIEVV